MSDALIRITTLSNLLVEQQRAVVEAEAQLRDAKAAQLRTEREDLPELMRELSLTEVKLSDGSTVSVKDEVDCAITEDNRAQAHAWLREHGYDGIIKTIVALKFGRNEAAAAQEIAAAIEAQFDRPAEVAEGVHPQTLKAFVKERMEAGVAVPFDLFSIRPYALAKVKAPTVRKTKAQ